eukprot:m.241591 g.241591  ORF g.241591 m.241591 type:complete len:160 (+) comp13876_c0_seq1:129-608(+)
MARIESLPALHLAGLSVQTVSIFSPQRSADPGAIPALWGRFMGALAALGVQGKTVYGLVTMAAADHSVINYTAAIAESDLPSLPADFVRSEYPGGKVARATHVGPLADLGDWMHALFTAQLPAQGIVVVDGPHLEIYEADRFCGGDKATSEMDLCVPTA